MSPQEKGRLEEKKKHEIIIVANCSLYISKAKKKKTLIPLSVKILLYEVLCLYVNVMVSIKKKGKLTVV